MRFFEKRLQRLILWFLRRHPQLALEALRQEPSSASFEKMPDCRQRSFEDLAWMLVSNSTNKGLLLLELDEAAYLFGLARSCRAAQILEIGRYRGGSAFLFAVASDDMSAVTSVDIAPQDDGLLRSALEKNGLLRKVNLVVGKSRDVATKEDFYDLIFIDGDHSYEGVAQDYQHWKRAVKPGGHLIFHNAAYGRAHAGVAAGPSRLAREIEHHDGEHYAREPDVGSLAVFLRTRKSWNVEGSRLIQATKS